MYMYMFDNTGSLYMSELCCYGGYYEYITKTP